MERDVGWRDPTDATGLGKIRRLNSLKLFAGFGAQMSQTSVVEARRNPLGGQAFLTLDIHALTRHVASLHQVIDDLFRDNGFDEGQFGQRERDVVPAYFRATNIFGKERAVSAQGTK